MAGGKRRVAAGRKIGGGRIRVDAARAVGKLRDHQLADPILWALEAVRAAMAAGAQAIHVEGDADDVWIAWEGEPLQERDLTRLFDELVSPSGEADKRATRLLATAVNAALGLSPRWLDVYRVEAGAARAVRYTARILMTAEDGQASALRELSALDSTLPADAPAITRGCVVHLKRYPWLETLTLLATGQEPRELRLIRQSCQDLPVPIRIGRGQLARPHAPNDVLRLGVGHPNAFIALTDAAGATPRPSLELCELGVVLMRAEFVLTAPLGQHARVPLRARLDLPKLPTNASRSAVRREAAEIRQWEREAAQALPQLVRIAARELSSERTRTWDDDALSRLRGGCIALLAASMRKADLWAELAGDVPEMFAPLLDAPLLRDALGATRTPREIGRARRQVVHYEEQVLDASLAPFFACVLWAPNGDPARALLPSRAAESTKAAVAKAKRWARARDAWLARPVIEATLTPDARRVVTHPLEAPGSSAHSCIPASLFAVDLELVGEISIAPAGAARTGIHLDFLVEGRRTYSARLEAPLEGVAIVSAPALRVEMDHETIAAGEHVTRIERAVLAAAVAACEAAARALSGRRAPSGERATFCAEDETSSSDAFALLTRAGTGLALRLLSGVPEQERPDPLLSERSPLVRAEAWPTVQGARIALNDLTRSARAQGVLAYASSALDGQGPSGRPVVVTTTDERYLLRAVTGVPALDYTTTLRRRLPEPGHLAGAIFPDTDHALIREHDTHRVAFGWGARRSVVRLWHMGRPIHFAGAAEVGEGAGEKYAMLLDDDRLVPSSDWRSVAQPPRDDALDRNSLERDLFVALADALLGRPPESLRLRVPDAARSVETLGAFLRSVARLDGRSLLGRARLEQLRKRAIFRVAFSASPASAESLGDAGALPFVPPDASSLRGDPVAGLSIALLPVEEARGAALLFGLVAKNADSVIRGHQRDAQRQARRARHLLQPKVETKLRGVRHPTDVDGTWVRGQLAYAPNGARHTRVELLAEARPLGHFEDGDLPYLTALVDVDPSRVSYEQGALTDPGLAHVQGALRAAARRLIETMAQRAPASILGEPQARALVTAFLQSKRHDAQRRDVKRARQALRGAPIFPTVQGEHASILDAQGAQGRTIRFCSATLEWIPPAPGERDSALDSPVLALPSDKNDPIRKLVDALAEGMPLRDCSAAIRRLLATRRVAQGLTRRPSLAQVTDARFRWKLEHLASRAASPLREQLELLGPGDVALRPTGPSQLHVFEAGVEVRVMDFDLIPPIEVAAEVSLVEPGKTPSPKITSRIARMMDAAASQAMREAIDAAPNMLPPWLLAQLRQSALIGGPQHLEALREIPLFVTTAGDAKTPAQLSDQVTRFGRVWYTSDSHVSTTPLDPERFALALSSADARRLEKFAPMLLATEELRLDTIARVNRARPRVRELGPTHEQSAWGIASAAEAHQGLRLFVMPLRPSSASYAQTWAYRDLQPLGSLEQSAPWPTCAWVDGPAFEPDRTWSAAAPGPLVDSARLFVRELSERLLAGQFAPVIGRISSLYVDEGICSATFSGRRDVQVRGMLWLSDPGEEDSVRITHASGAVRLAPRDPRHATLPLCGELIVSGAEAGALSQVLSSIVRFAYRRMMRELAADLCRGEARDEQLWLAQLLRALELGAPPDLEADADPVLPFIDPRMTYSELVHRTQSRLEVLVVTDDERGRAHALGTDWPCLIDDGSLASLRARAALGACAVAFRDELTRRVLDEETRKAQDAPAAERGNEAAAPPTRKRGKAREGRSHVPGPLQPARPDGMPPADRVQDLCGRIGRATSTGAGLAHVRCRAEGSRHPIASLSERGDEVVIAADHVAVRALSDARTRREAAVILAAQAAMLLSRAAAQGPERELAAIERLLAEDP